MIIWCVTSGLSYVCVVLESYTAQRKPENKHVGMRRAQRFPGLAEVEMAENGVKHQPTHDQGGDELAEALHSFFVPQPTKPVVATCEVLSVETSIDVALTKVVDFSRAAASAMDARIDKNGIKGTLYLAWARIGT